VQENRRRLHSATGPVFFSTAELLSAPRVAGLQHLFEYDIAVRLRARAIALPQSRSVRPSDMEVV
jgi:hypothetical protein